jgi:hypothetical protein
MNKPRASWVYIKHFYTVPYRVLMRWNKVSQQLTVSTASLTQLRADIERKYSVQLRDAMSRLTACPRASEPTSCYSTNRTRHIPPHPQDHRSHPMPYQQHEIPKPGGLAPTNMTKPRALGPQHSIRGKDMAHQRITKPSWSQDASITGASIRPHMMHSWRQATAA